MLKKAGTVTVARPPMWFSHSPNVSDAPVIYDHLLLTWVNQQIGPSHSTDASELRNALAQDSVLPQLLSRIMTMEDDSTIIEDQQAFTMAKLWLNKDMPDMEADNIADASSERVAQFVLALLLKHLSLSVERALAQSNVWPSIDQSVLLSDTSFHKLRRLLSSWYQTISLEYLPVFPWLADDEHFLIAWRTGAAILLILHYSNPNCVAIHRIQDAYVSDSPSVMSNNIDIAMDTALNQFGVEKRLSAQDIIGTRSLNEISCIIYLCELCITTIPNADGCREIRQKCIYDERQSSTQGDGDDLHRLPDMATRLHIDGNSGSEQKMTIDELEDIAFNIRHMVNMLRVKLDDCVPRRSIAFRRDDASLNLTRAATPSTYSEASVTSASMEDDDATSLHSTRTVHPLQAIDDDNSGYGMTLENTIEAVQRYRNHDIHNFYIAAQALQHESSESSQRVTVILESINELDQSLGQDMTDAKEAYQRFERGYDFSKEAKLVRSELDFIQAKMVKTTTTNTGITELEDRAKHAFEAIVRLGDEFNDLLSYDFPDQSYKNNLDALVQKYELVQAWVEEVRIWFAEAERIREWIESRIGILEDKNIVDPLDEEIKLTQNEVEALNTEHEALEQEIELFNKEDMTRLRAHVKDLTGSERGDKDLSPADTTTIEITLTTLMTLDRLMYLLRQKTYTLQILTMRVLWEDEFTISTSWVKDVEEQTTDFLRGEARWRVHVDMCTTSEDSEHQPRTNHIDLRSNVINRLLALEHGIAEFDQGQFTNTLNTFQDLEDANAADIPQHLESRQSGLESTFETLAGRVSFARKVVEQRLTMMEYVQQYIFVRNEGKSVLQALDEMCANAAPNMDDEDINQRVDTFQSNVLHLCGAVTNCIMYPQHVSPVDEADNDESNNEIRAYAQARNSELDDKVAVVQTKLTTLRRLIQEHNEASDILSNLETFAASVSKLFLTAEESAIQINDVDLKLSQADVRRLKTAIDEASLNVQELKSNNWESLKTRLNTLKSQVHAEQCSIDFLLLTNKVSELDSMFDRYTTFLAHQGLLSEVLSYRLQWESSYESFSEEIMDANSKLWTAAKKARWRPIETLTLVTHVAKTSSRSKTKALRDSHDALDSMLKTLEMDSMATTSILCSTFLESYTQVQTDIGLETSQAFLDHVNQRQHAVKSQFEDLKTVLSFHRDLLEQRSSICDLLDDVAILENDGNTWLEQMHQMTASSSQHLKIDFSAQIEQFTNRIGVLFPKRLLCIQMIHQPKLQLLEQLSDENDEELDRSMRDLLMGRESDLLTMAEDLKAAQDRYLMTMELKAQVLEYEQCAADLCTWMLKHSQKLSDCKLELTSVARSLDRERLNSVIELQNERYHEIDEITRKKLDDLGTKITELEDAIIQKGASDVDITPATSAYDLAVADMAILIHAMEGHGRDIDARKQHLILHQLLSSGQQEAKSYQDQINQLSAELDHLIENDQSSEIQKTDVTNLMARCTGIDNELIDFDNRIGSQIRAGLSDLERLCSQLLEPEGPPVDLTRSILDFEDCFIKLRESTSILRTRIDRLNECLDCLSNAAAIISWYDIHESDLRTFVEDRARWNPDINSAQVDIQKLSEEVDNIKINLDICEGQRIEPCLAILGDIKRTFIDLKSVNMVSRLESIQSLLETGLQRLHDHIAFADTIIAQNRSSSWYLVKIADMQQQAEGIKSNLTTHANDSSSRLDEMSVLEAQMLATQQESNMRISYPVRSFIGHDEQDAEQDTSVNIMLKETVKARNAQLQQTLATIKAIVQSNEKMCLRKAAVRQYREQADSLMIWLASKLLALQEASSDDDSTTNSLEDNMANLIKVQSVGAALAAYQLIYDDLKHAADDTIRFVSSDGSDETDEEPTDSSEIIEIIKQTQSGVDGKWKEVTRVYGNVKSKLEADDETLQLGKSLQVLLSSCEILFTEVSDTAEDEIDSDKITQWTTRLDDFAGEQMTLLRDQHAQQQQSREQHALSPSLRNQALLDEIDQMIQQVKLIIGHHVEKLNQKNTLDLYITSGSEIMESMNSKSVLLAQFNLSSGHLTGDSKVDSHQQQAILDMICYMEANIVDLEERYQRYCLRDLPELASSGAAQQQKADIQNILQNLKEDLLKTKTMLDNYNTALAHQEAIHKVNSDLLPAIESRLRTLSADLYDSATLIELTANVHAVKGILQQLESHNNELDDQQCGVNKGRLQRLYAEAKNAFDQASTRLKHLQVKQDQSSLSTTFLTACATLQDLCKEQANLVLVTMDSTAKSQFYAKDPTFIERLLRQCISIHTSAETEYKRLGSQIDLQTADLERITGGDELKMALDGAHVAWNRLRSVLDREQRQLDFVRKMFAFAKASNEIYAWMEGCKRALHNVDMASIDEIDQRYELEELQAKVNSFEPTMKAFNNMVVSLLKDKSDQVIDLIDINVKNEDVLAAIDMRSGRVLAEWEALKKQFASIQSNAETNLQGATIARKGKEITALVDKFKTHLSTLSVVQPSPNTQQPLNLQELPLSQLISEREVIVVEAQMSSLEKEVEYHLNQKINDLDVILASVSTLQDGEHVRQRAEIVKVVTELANMMEEKHQEIGTALKLAGFVNAIDELEVLLTAVQEAVDPCTTQNKAGRTQSKADFQALLIELDTRFKYYGPRIREKLEETKCLADEFEDDARISEKYNHVEQQWNQLYEQATQAKSQLTSRINEMRETTPMNYLDSRTTQPPRPHSVAGVRTRKISERTSTVISRAMTPNPRSSTSSQTSTRGLGKSEAQVPRMRRATMTPTPSRSGKGASVPPRYVPDPKSDLDVQLGKVVNESPYKVRIKMVPGEVGKYWFGEVEPRLVYCRILRSNMVMVRVGGGWTELSQFLRDHALLEGRLIPNRDEKKKPDVREAYLRTRPKDNTTTTGQDDIITRSLAASEGESSDTTKISRSTPNRGTPAQQAAGVKDGNRFLMTVDGEGNRLEISMKKAMDHEPRLTSAPRRSHHQ